MYTQFVNSKCAKRQVTERNIACLRNYHVITHAGVSRMTSNFPDATFFRNNYEMCALVSNIISYLERNIAKDIVFSDLSCTRRNVVNVYVYAFLAKSVAHLRVYRISRRKTYLIIKNSLYS